MTHAVAVFLVGGLIGRAARTAGVTPKGLCYALDRLGIPRGRTELSTRVAAEAGRQAMLDPKLRAKAIAGGKKGGRPPTRKRGRK